MAKKLAIEGGLITTNNPEYFEKARLTSMFGEKVVPEGAIRPYDAYTMGFNYRSQEIEYNPSDYPETVKMFDTSFVIYSIYPPNDLELMRCYVEAFHKVFNNLETIVENPSYCKPKIARVR